MRLFDSLRSLCFNLTTEAPSSVFYPAISYLIFRVSQIILAWLLFVSKNPHRPSQSGPKAAAE